MSVARRCGWLAAAIMLLAGTPRLQAQATHPIPFAALRSDSAAWQRVLTYVVRTLSPGLVQAAADSAAQPWELHLPAAEPQRQLLERQLRLILRARAPRPGDTITHRLDIGALRIVHDTALVVVQVDETRKCPGSSRTTGSGWIDTVRVARFTEQRVWGAAFSRGVLAGDRFGC